MVNLATNARDAMPQGGTITIAATPERIMDNGHAEGLEPGGYVRLTVADTGTGIEAATLSRVMEPFFTTKEQGKGTGLGLPMARGFAQQSGGALTISSDPGLGTVVALWLPVSATEIVRPDHSRKPAASINGEKKPSLLLVEDEELVREVVAEQLIDRGYDVIEAEGGRRALALLDAGCPVDLIISDLSMPGMDGVSLIARAIRKPRLPAILLTGYAGRIRRTRCWQGTGWLVQSASQAGYWRPFGRSNCNAVAGHRNGPRWRSRRSVAVGIDRSD